MSQLDNRSIYDSVFRTNGKVERPKYRSRNKSISVTDYLLGRGISFKGSSDWASIKCPAHKGGQEKRPSLQVNLTEGHFRCLTCNVSGGNLIALHSLFTGKSYREAALELREK